jgi:hypothetical protein
MSGPGEITKCIRRRQGGRLDGRSYFSVWGEPRVHLSKSGFIDEHYEQAWAKLASNLSADGEERTENVLQLIPPDCVSVLDTGCGGGRLSNRPAPTSAGVAGWISSLSTSPGRNGEILRETDPRYAAQG